MNAFKKYGLSIVLFLLFITSWIGQLLSEWQVFVNESQSHNQPPQVSQFMPEFLQSTFENWQSEFLQLFSFVLLSSYLIHKGSPQSKDSDEELKQKIENIEKALKKKK